MLKIVMNNNYEDGGYGDDKYGNVYDNHDDEGDDNVMIVMIVIVIVMIVMVIVMIMIGMMVIDDVQDYDKE